MDYYFNDGSWLVPANTSTLYKGKHNCTNNARREVNCKLVNVCIANFQLFCYLKTFEATKSQNVGFSPAVTKQFMQLTAKTLKTVSGSRNRDAGGKLKTGQQRFN